MGKPRARYAAKAEPGVGWFVWDRKRKRKWGNPFQEIPEELIEELNGEARPERITELSKKMKRR